MDSNNILQEDYYGYIQLKGKRSGYYNNEKNCSNLFWMAGLIRRWDSYESKLVIMGRSKESL